MTALCSPLDFFGRLNWINGKPLLDTIEPYRRDFLTMALYTFRDDGSPQYNMVLAGRAKKNNKTTDLVLAAFYRLMAWESPQGTDGYIVANDEDQAGDDLELAKKLIRANPGTLGRDCIEQLKAIKRRDGAGTMRILPARDAVGSHGKTALFIGFDEIHGLKNHDLLEALAPDPTRADTLTWITSYDSVFNTPGVPLFDLKAVAKAGDDPRMLFSWYSADFCTDPDFADAEPERRANPSMDSWPEGPAYLSQQRRRLPAHKFRRLHLNLPGAPNGAFLDGDMLEDAIIPGLRAIPRRAKVDYAAFVDMSGGSSDDAVLGVGHKEGSKRILDLLVSQDGGTPFDPYRAVSKFVRHLNEYGLKRVHGDAYAGETFRFAFEQHGIKYIVSRMNKTELYEEFEPRLNAREFELLDIPKLREQALGLIVRGAQIDHQNGAHDDFVNAAAGVLTLALDETAKAVPVKMPAGFVQPKMADPLEMFR